MKRFLIFQVGDRQFGIELPLVWGIHGAGALLSGQEENAARGMLMMHGQSTPLLDLSNLLHKEEFQGPMHERKIIHAHTASQGIALLVDRVEQPISAGEDDLEPLPPILSDTSCACFPAVLDNSGTLVLLVDPEEIEFVGQQMKEKEKAVSTPEQDDELDADEEIIDLTEVVETPADREADIPDSDLQIPGIPDAAPVKEMEPETLFPSLSEQADADGILPFSAEQAPRVVEEPGRPVMPETGTGIQRRPAGGKAEVSIDPASIEMVLMNMMAQKSMSDKVIRIFSDIVEAAVRKKMSKVKRSLLAGMLNQGKG